MVKKQVKKKSKKEISKKQKNDLGIEFVNKKDFNKTVINLNKEIVNNDVSYFVYNNNENIKQTKKIFNSEFKMTIFSFIGMVCYIIFLFTTNMFFGILGLLSYLTAIFYTLKRLYQIDKFIR